MTDAIDEVPLTTLFAVTHRDDALDRVNELAVMEVSGVEAPDVRKAVKAFKSVTRHDLSSAVEKMWDLDVIKVMAEGWSRAQKIRTAITESAGTPGKLKTVDLSEHVIESAHKPRLVLSIAGSDWCQVEFRIGLSLAIHSAQLGLLGGVLTEIRLGPSTGKVKLECKGVELKEFHHEFKLFEAYKLKRPIDLKVFAKHQAGHL